jgi:glutathione synthase/RimK-type ligase-like ATP-grasp enzyme
MANICVIHPTISKESAEYLAQEMGWDVCNPFKENKRDFSEYLGVFNYGCNRKIVAKNVINKSKSVATCINKVATYEVFKKAGVPTVAYVTNKRLIPKDWETVVVRKEVDGAQAKDLDYWYPKDGSGNPCPEGALFTEYFPHVRELRVVVFCEKVVAVYKKVDQLGSWEFVPITFSVCKGQVAADAITAAKALDIDYVGFDVLVAEDGSYRFLEANTGAILTHGVLKKIKQYL